MTATQKDSEHEAPANNSEEIMATLKKARNEAKSSQARARAEEKARLKAEKALSEAQEALQAVRAENEAERHARIQVEKTLAEVQVNLNVAQGEVQRERQARIDAEKAESASAEYLMKSIGVEAEKVDLPPMESEEGVEQRVSFVVRLTIDERGQPKRTEIEHPLSGKRESFPSLDVNKLAAFMKACISLRVIPEDAGPQAPPPEPIEALKLVPPVPATRLTISNVQAFRMGDPDIVAIALTPDEPFVIQTRFRIEGPEAALFTAKESSFELKIYAQGVLRRTATLLATHQSNLVKDVLEYASRMQASGLPPGPYRFLVIVVVDTPLRLSGIYEGPVIRVVEVQPSARLNAPMQQ